MNTLGLSLIVKMGCLCTKDVVSINGQKFYVIEELGSGGFSVVSLVENVRTRKRYAVKKIICHSADDQKIALDEVQYHRLLDHPNILCCIDSAVEGVPDPVLNSTSQVLLLLPYYPRGTLVTELEIRRKKGQHFSVEDVLRIFLQICEGVKVFHDAKPIPLAHRDLKTGNILLDVDLSPVIIDLGSVAPAVVTVITSRDAQKLQDIASERCTMSYRAPELFNVETSSWVDQRVDIWSLGCLLYALCYFESPFDSIYEKGDSVALAVISGNVSFPDISPYPEEVHDLIKYMLNVNPMERPFIYNVIERGQEILVKVKNAV